MTKDNFTEQHPPPEPPALKSLDLTDSHYLRLKREVDYVNENIPKSLGSYDPDLHLAELVNLEVKLIAPLKAAMYCQDMAYKWRKEKNPYIADLITLACQHYGFSPPPSLIIVLGEAAIMRVNGDPAGTPDKLKNENAERQALVLMANLIYAGDSLLVASRKAAQWRHDTFPELKRKKASTLEAYYAEKMRRAGVEHELFSNWRKNQDHRDEEQLDEQWQTIRELLQPADDDLTGVRRR